MTVQPGIAAADHLGRFAPSVLAAEFQVVGQLAMIELFDVFGLRRWMSELPPGDGVARLFLLESDLASLTISFTNFVNARSALNQRHQSVSTGTPISRGVPFPADSMTLMFHYAKSFVVEMRRFARILEATDSRRSEYPPQVREAIKLAWAASKSSLSVYVGPRNAIEHIDGEVNGTNRRFLNLWGDQLEVVAAQRVAVTREALAVAERAWRRIVSAVMAPAEERMLFAVRNYLVAVLRERVARGSNVSTEAQPPA